MSRTPGQFCSRASMYPGDNNTPALPETTEPRAALTWQQKEAFGNTHTRNRKGPQWVPFDYTTAAETPPSVPFHEDPWSVQQPSSTPGEDESNPVNTQQPAEKTRKAQKKHRLCKANQKEKKPVAMQSLPKSAYVPPHLRRSAEAPTAQLGAGIDAVASSADPPISTDDTVGVDTSKNPPLLPSKPHEQEQATGYTGWHTPSLAPATTPADHPRRHKKTIWPKARDMRAPTDQSSDGGVTFMSDSGGDPDYDVKKLLDWNGDWMPPPEQWAARKGYHDRHFGRAIEQWVDGHPKDIAVMQDISADSYKNGEELVSRSWALPMIEQKSLKAFWRGLPTTAPAALSDVDITADPPWWERYHGTTCYLWALEVPHATVDPQDLDNHIAGAEGLASVTERLQAIHRDRLEAQQRRAARQRRPVRQVKYEAPIVDDRRIVPRMNVYVRPIQPTDVRGVLDIYNYYVENTIHAFEFVPLDEGAMRDRIDTITRPGLPFLVAVSKANNTRPKNPQGYLSERIVGFTFLDEYCVATSMYRYSFELELFVHPGYLQLRIGSCLLDKVLEMVNTGYTPRGGYEYVNNFDYLKTGPSRVVKTIMLRYHLEHGETEDKTTEFLKAYNFHRAGHFNKFGYKYGRVVDAVWYQHITTEEINAGGRPTGDGGVGHV